MLIDASQGLRHLALRDSTQAILNASLHSGGSPKLLQQHRVREHARIFGGFRADAMKDPRLAIRLDAVVRESARRDADLGDGWYMARELESIRAEEMKQAHAVPNAFLLFPMDTSIPMGARSYTLRKRDRTGSAALWKGGNENIPRVSVQRGEVQRPIHFLANAYDIDWMEMQAESFGQTGRRAALDEASRDVMMEVANELFWYGNESSDIWGILTHPFIAKKDTSLNIYDGGSTADAILTGLHALANYAWETSKQVFRPDTMSFSPRMFAYIHNTRLGTDNDTTIAKHFLEHNGHIKQLKEAHELESQGPDGSTQDAILVHRNDPKCIRLVVPGGGMQQLPEQQQGFCYTTHNVMAIGGVECREIGAVVIGYAKGAA